MKNVERGKANATMFDRKVRLLGIAGFALMISGCVAPGAGIGSAPTRVPVGASKTDSPVETAPAAATPRANLQGVPVGVIGSVTVKSDPQAVADAAVSTLGAMGTNAANAGRSVPIKVTSLTAVQASSLDRVAPGAGAPEKGSADDRVVWVVRAEGPFIGLRVPPGGEPIKATAGYILVDDLTDKVIGLGMP